MDKPRLSQPTRDVLSRGYRQVTDIKAERDELRRRVRDPGNIHRQRDAKALDTVEFHEKILRVMIAALEGAPPAE